MGLREGLRGLVRPAREDLLLTPAAWPECRGAFCPALQGCYTQGASYEEALSNLEDAIRLHIEDRLAEGDPVPVSGMVSLATLEIRV